MSVKKHIFYVFVLVFTFAFILRSYRLADTMIFASDQGEFLLDAASLLEENKVRLIGIYVSSKQVEDKYFFIGSQFSYLLAFGQRLLGHEPYRLTLMFVFINALTVAFSFMAAFKISGNLLASVSASLIYAANFFAIKYSRTIWNPALQPFLSVLVIFVVLYLRRRLRLQSLLAGLILGVSFAVEYSSVIIFPVIIYLLVVRRKWRESIESLLFLAAGFLVGTLNLIVFDLRHDFYNSRLIIKYYLSYSGGVSFSPQHILPLLPFFCLGVAWLFTKVKRVRVLVMVVIGVILLELGYFYIKLKDNNEVFGMPRSLTYKKIDKAAKIVAADRPRNFNIAQLVDTDRRSFSLRYVLGYTHSLRGNMRGMDEYSLSDTLYVLHYSGQNVEQDGSYELSSFGSARQVVDSWDLGDGIVVSKVIPQ